MSMRWRKVWGDLRQYWLSISLITLALAIGTAGVVASLNARAILKREIANSTSAAIAPDIALVYDKVTAELLSAVAGEADVVAVDARRVTFTRVKVKDGTWLPMRLTVVRDFSAQQLGAMHLHGGAWPAQDGSILIEQSGQSLIDAKVGGALQLRTSSGEIATLPVGGFVHDPAVAPSTQERLIYAFVTPATAALMGQNATLDQLILKMAYRGSFSGAAEFGTALNAALKRKGQPAMRVDALPAGHPHAALMNAVVQVLGVVSALALICSSALAGYLIAARMRREVAQIGIMKTLGARSHQVAWQYLALVVPMVGLALVVGVIAGTLLGVELVRINATSMNIDIASWQAPPLLMLEEIAFAFCLPLLAMAIPVVRAAGMTARAAIQDAGITMPSAAATRCASMLLKFPGSVSWTFALRNTWRRPWRLLVMVLALSSGGALLLMNHTNYDSMISVIDTSLANQGQDIAVLMQRSVPGPQLENIARRVSEVATAEAWRRASVSLAGSEAGTGAAPANDTSRFSLVGYPHGTSLFTLPVVSGRAPKTGSDGEVLITRSLQQPFPQLQVGSVGVLQFRDRRTRVLVVGVVEQIGPPAMYADFATFEAATAMGDVANEVLIKSRSPDINAVANALDQAFLDARIAPGQIISRAMIRDALVEHFKVVGEVIRMVALAAALVGAIILAATTGLNVLERTREIGIIRTMGATPRRIAVFFLVESGAVAFASALLAIAISLALSRAILNLAERTLLQVTVPMQFSMQGLAILCGGVLVVMLMVLLTLAYSLRKSVRETLSYE